MVIIYRKKPLHVVLDDDVLTDEVGHVAVGGSLHLRLDDFGTTGNTEQHKTGVENPMYGTLHPESES